MYVNNQFFDLEKNGAGSAVVTALFRTEVPKHYTSYFIKMPKLMESLSYNLTLDDFAGGSITVQETAVLLNWWRAVF